nr:ATP-binding protein [uncultured Desulfobacter sp.]
MKLFYKIFSVNLLVLFILLVSVFAVIRITADRHFRQVRDEVENQIYVLVAKKLADHYRQTNSWDRFAVDPQVFNGFIDTVIKNNESTWALPFHPGDPPGPPPQPPPGHGFKGEKPSLHEQQITLYSADRNPIAGPLMSDGDGGFRPILLDQVPVGWLRFKKHEKPFVLPGPSALLRERLNVLYILGILLFLIAGAASYFLSRYILSPVDELTRGTRALTQFKFSTRIQARSSDELGRLGEDFNRMARTLEKYETLRTQWMADISHELRTPLSILRGELEALQEGIRTPTPERIDSLHAEVIYLEKIVKDLHVLTVADSGVLAMEEKSIRPVEILISVLKLSASRLETEGILLEKDFKGSDVEVFGDEIRIKQLFSNIIENNLKYSLKPGPIKIQSWVEPKTLNISIEDSGPGVPVQFLGKIFDRLFRVDPSRTREQGGSGLGLSICKSIADAHGWQISANLSPAGGLVIRLIIPLEKK